MNRPGAGKGHRRLEDQGRLDSCSIVGDGGLFFVLRKNCYGSNGATWRQTGGTIFRNHRTTLLSAQQNGCLNWPMFEKHKKNIASTGGGIRLLAKALQLISNLLYVGADDDGSG